LLSPEISNLSNKKKICGILNIIKVDIINKLIFPEKRLRPLKNFFNDENTSICSRISTEKIIAKNNSLCWIVILFFNINHYCKQSSEIISFLLYVKKLMLFYPIGYIFSSKHKKQDISDVFRKIIYTVN